MSVFIGSINGTTPSKVDKALQKRGMNITMHRGREGYYYFTGDHDVPSIWAYNLSAYSTDEVINHVIQSIKK